jgi:hypothetical protein
MQLIGNTLGDGAFADPGWADKGEKISGVKLDIDAPKKPSRAPAEAQALRGEDGRCVAGCHLPT